MNCLWKDVPNSTDARGWRRVQCQRPGCERILNPTPHAHSQIKAKCKGLPFQWEWGYWLAIWLGVFGVSKRNVGWLAYRIGLANGCGCAKREAALNTIGERFASLFKRKP
jgi:hypothetical protein